MQEHRVSVARSARYFTLGDPSGGVAEVWFACHGYGQLASRFLEKLRALDDGTRYLVAPEGLSRFYLSESPAERRVGASWMTREDRLAEIADYVRYLDAVCQDVFKQLDRSQVAVHALGYSQGAATVARWTALGRAKVDRLTERIVKSQAQLDAWRMERKELKTQLADAKTADRAKAVKMK